MTSVHIVPTGEPGGRHTLADCHCGPRLRPRHREDGTLIDWVHVHRSPLDDEDAKAIARRVPCQA